MLCTLLTLQIGASCYGSSQRARTSPGPKIKALHAQAEAAERKRDYHSARAYYQQAVDEAPDSASAAYATLKMASALVFWGELAPACTLLGKSLEHDPSQVPVWHDLGVLQAKLGRPEAARKSLMRAVELAPKEPRSRIALAALLVQQSEFRLAQTHYETLLTLDIPPKIEEAIHRALGILEQEIARQRN